MKIFMITLLCFVHNICVAQNVGSLSSLRTISIERGHTELSKGCIECHAKEHPGIVNDWKNSRHGHASVSCVDCHQVNSDSPMASQNCPGIKGTDVYISPLVSPATCKRCHPKEVEDFSNSGHFRSWLQIEGKDDMQKLMFFHEGQSHPKYSGAPKETGCMQCHGSRIKLDNNNRPDSSSWPNAGMGTVYPDGSVGNCAACHTRHRFNVAEARHPRSCASCHLGPDHPDIEIFENSKHGHIFLTEGSQWTMDSAPDAWEPGDYRAPTCATCHVSGIGDLNTTHNVSSRLKWNLWAKKSSLRSSPDPLSPLTGDAKSGREQMRQVCSNCHSETHTEGFFKQGDSMVHLYNESYFQPADNMLNELKSKGLLDENPWNDEFQKVYYHLWHHQGRRARQGALMGGPDWAHWHGVFELQQDIYELKKIYNERIKKNKAEH